MYGIHDGTYNTTEGPGLGREPLLLLLALNGLKFHRNKSSAFRRKFNAYSNNLKTFFKITHVNLLSSGILFMLNGRREGERRDGGSFWAAPALSGHRAKGATHYLTILQIFTARFILQISKQFQEFPCLPQAAKLKSGRGYTERISAHFSHLLDVPQHWPHFLPGVWALALQSHSEEHLPCPHTDYWRGTFQIRNGKGTGH